MAIGSGMTRNSNTECSWEGCQESVEEACDVDWRMRWKEKKKAIALS